MENRRFISALCIAVVGHLGLAWIWHDNKIEDVREQPTRIEVSLYKTAPRNIYKEPTQLAPLVESQLPPPANNAVVQNVEQELTDTLEVTPAISTIETVVTAVEPSTVKPAVPILQIPRAKEWRLYSSPGSQTRTKTQAFRRYFFERLQTREQHQARQTLLGQRQVAVSGLAPDAYNALESAGSNHLKTNAGCFDLRANVTGKVGGDKRWWRTKCNEIVRQPWQLAPLEFDAIGRALP